MPVPTSGSQYLTSNSAYFDQQTPQTNAVFRQRLTPSRYRAQSIATTSTGVVTINMGQMNSKCLVTGTTVTFENAYRHDLNGPHIITSLPADPSNLLFTVEFSLIQKPPGPLSHPLLSSAQINGGGVGGLVIKFVGYGVGVIIVLNDPPPSMYAVPAAPHRPGEHTPPQNSEWDPAFPHLPVHRSRQCSSRL